MEIIYKNPSRQSITESQALILTSYYKCFVVNNEIKDEENYLNGKLFFQIHYRQAGESIQQILDSFFVEGELLTIRERSPIGDFIFEADSCYNREGILDFKENKLYDRYNNEIGYEQITDISSGIPLYENTHKYYYDPNIDLENFLFECSYYDDGTLMHILIDNEVLQMDDQDSEAFDDTEESLERLQSLIGISTQLFEYYISPNVYPDFII